MDAARSYTGTAKALHWAMAVVIIVAAIIGLYAASLSYGSDPAQNAYKGGVITLHKNIATLSIFLIVARILWRVTHRPPALVGMSPLMVGAAHFGHFLLYVLMIVVPLSGWAYSSSAGYEIPVAGLFTIQALMGKTPDLVPVFAEAHEILTWTLIVVVLGHIGFALKHHFIDRDDVLRAMCRYVAVPKRSS